MRYSHGRWGCPATVPGKHPDTFVYASYGTVRTLDPCVAYDTVSDQRVRNIYEPLVFFDGAATDKFVPVLAEAVPSLENGGISPDGRTYTFTIRKGVIRFHEGGELTAGDAAYSLKRNMMADPDGGPMWMLLEALTGEGSTRDKDGRLVPGIFERDRCGPLRPPAIRLFSICPGPTRPSWGFWPMGHRSYSTRRGPSPGGAGTAMSPMPPGSTTRPRAMNLSRRSPTAPAPIGSNPGSRRNSLFSSGSTTYWNGAPTIKTAIFKYVKEWSTRKLMLQNGDADRVLVDTPYVPELKAMDGLTLYKVAQLAISSACFCREDHARGKPQHRQRPPGR